MANIYNLLQNGFNTLFSGGNKTDRYTRPLALGSNFFNVLGNNSKESYDTINNNEFNLYSTTPQLYIVINRFATMLTNGVFFIKDWKTGKVIENHPLLKLLEKPNPLMNRNEWLTDLSVNYNIYGNSYTFMNKGSMLSEYPTTLMNLPNYDMKIEKTGKVWRQTDINEIIKQYVLTDCNEKFTPNEIIHIKTSNQADPIIGLSPLHAIQMPISNIRGAYGFRNVNITKRGALGLISPEMSQNGMVPLDSQTRKDLEQQYLKDNGIFDGQTPVKFSTTPVKYQNLSHAIKDNMLFEEVDANLKAIIDNYGLNENIFSRANASKFSNLNEGLKMSYQDGIIPFAEKLCWALNESLGLFSNGQYVELDFSNIQALQDNEETNAKTIKLKSEALSTLLDKGYKQEDAEVIVGLRS